MNRSLSVLLILVIAGFIAPAAFAQSERVLECGAQIFSYSNGERICLAATGRDDRSRVARRSCTQKDVNHEILWRIDRRDGGGMHLLTALDIQAERRLEVADFNKNDGATIQIWGPNVFEGYRSQTWDFFPVVDLVRGVQGFMIISIDSGKCLNAPAGQEFVQLSTCSRSPNDIWWVLPVLPRQDCS